MAKGLIIHNGTDLDATWAAMMVIDTIPIAVAPTNFASTLAAGGSLAAGTYYYRVTAIGINGEGAVETVEESQIAAAGNRTINLSWDAQYQVDEYRVYRGVAPGVYTGFYRVFTNSFSDNGLQSMDTSATVPPATNPITGVAGSHGGVSWVGKRSIVQLGISPVINHTYIPAVANATDNVPEASKVHVYNDGYDGKIDIDTLSVIEPAAWNTPNSDAGALQAVADIASWSV